MLRQIVFKQNRTAASRALMVRSLPVQRSVVLTNYRYKSTIMESAKETLSDLNKKIGEAAAAGIEKTEKAVRDTDITGKAKAGMNAVNEKVGQAAASGIEALQSTANSLNTDEAADKVKSKASDISDKASGAVDAAKSKASDVADDASDAVDSAKSKATGVAEDVKSAAEQGYEEKVEGTPNDLKSKAKETLDRAKETANEVLNGESDTKKFGSSTLTEEDLFNDLPPKEGSEHVKENHKGYKSLQQKGKEAYSEQNRPEDFM